ncbi:MAG: FAD-dependent oxidoreductase [Armatimonadetes bacterium]|nr:FAD-dependent oxidoreductase [Armatimonadota bacterium]
MRVAIVGAGYAGLRTAMLLEQHGVEVVVLEARDRVGGRAETVHVGGGFYEAGGEWIDADHHRCVSLLAEFGQKPEVSQQWPGTIVYQGEQAAEDQPWPDAAADLEGIEKAAADLCRRMPADLAADPEWRALDDRSLAKWLDNQCSSRRGRWLAEAVYRSDEGEDTDRVGLLGWLQGYKHYLDREEGDMSAFRFPEGAQGLCDRMAGTLASPVSFGWRLRSVEQGDDHVALWSEGEVVVADRAVLTMPPTCLRDIDFGPDPFAQQEAWSSVAGARAIKVALRFTHAFWQGSSPRTIADLPFQQVWDGGRGGLPLLCCYICGNTAEAVARAHDPVRHVLRAVGEVFAQAQEAFVEGWLHDWVRDPWALGAYSCLAPGASRTRSILREPVGRVHLAGEGTADWIGFYEGALESAERVVQEVMDAG